MVQSTLARLEISLSSDKFPFQAIVDHLDEFVALEDVLRLVRHAASVRCTGPQAVGFQIIEDDAVMARVSHVEEFVELKEITG